MNREQDILHLPGHTEMKFLRKQMNDPTYPVYKYSLQATVVFHRKTILDVIIFNSLYYCRFFSLNYKHLETSVVVIWHYVIKLN